MKVFTYIYSILMIKNYRSRKVATPNSKDKALLTKVGLCPYCRVYMRLPRRYAPRNDT